MPTTDRNQRRRERTRASLLDAAKRLIAERGRDGFSINELTELADVGFGSFYNHFDSRDDIVRAVAEETRATESEGVESLVANREDPAEVVAAIHAYYVRLARRHPARARLLVRLDVASDVLHRQLGSCAEAAIERGAAAGRFAVPDTRLAICALSSALAGVMHAVLMDVVADNADVHHAQAVLCLLGVPLIEAAAIARRSVT